jgi:hypothetical protein
MSELLGACMIAVALYCAVRFFRPGLQVAEHGRRLEVWHVLMVGTMAVMLLASTPRDLWGLGVAVFGVGLVWSLVQVVRRHLPAAHLRVAVACTAMVAMLLPVAPAVAAPAGGAQMDMRMPASGASGGHAMGALPMLLTVLLLEALGVVLVVSVVRLVRRTSPANARADACCEGLMTLAMGYMLLSLG